MDGNDFEYLNEDADFDLFDEKIAAAFAPEETSLQAFTANVLIGNVPAKRLNDCVGEGFRLFCYYAKKIKLPDGKEGKLITLFGKKDAGRYHSPEPCAYTTTSLKVYDALKKIAMVYGQNLTEKGVNVRIRMNKLDNDSKAYTLEVV